jgi:acetyl esterase/lipase
MRRSTSAVSAILLSLALLAAPVSADEPPPPEEEELPADYFDVAPDTSETLYGWLGPDEELPPPPEMHGVLEEDDYLNPIVCEWPDEDEEALPDEYGVQFTRFVDDDSPFGWVYVKLDIYYPDDFNTELDYPAMIMIHGGGWGTGCRRNVQNLANMATAEGYIVFAIDHRMGCDEGDTTYDEQIRVLCDQPAPAAVTDSLAAVEFVRDPPGWYGGGDWEDSFNGDIAALGFSSGGNLAFMLGVLGPSNVDTDVQVVGGYSGTTEVGLLAEENPEEDRYLDPCDEAWGQKQAACRAARELYVGGCELFPVPEGGEGSEDEDYQDCLAIADDASPWSVIEEDTPAEIAPVYIANATDELTPYQEALDYELQLEDESVTVHLCTIGGVDQHRHATGLDDKQCYLEGVTTWVSTMDFFDDWVTIP